MKYGDLTKAQIIEHLKNDEGIILLSDGHNGVYGHIITFWWHQGGKEYGLAVMFFWQLDINHESCITVEQLWCGNPDENGEMGLSILESKPQYSHIFSPATELVILPREYSPNPGAYATPIHKFLGRITE